MRLLCQDGRVVDGVLGFAAVAHHEGREPVRTQQALVRQPLEGQATGSEPFA